MKKSIAVDIHSFVDIITNSSTELFVCDTKKSIEQVEEILREKLKHFGTLWDRDYVFEEVFQPPFIYTQEMLDKSEKYRWEYEVQDNVGKIIITGTDENSIPYEMWDVINSLFEATNFHLG